jgi:hypothetical protein
MFAARVEGSSEDRLLLGVRGCLGGEPPAEVLGQREYGKVGADLPKGENYTTRLTAIRAAWRARFGALRRASD